MEEARLTLSVLVTLGAAIGILGGRYILLEGLSKFYCMCGHEYNEHNIVPKGYAFTKEQSDGTCKECNCKEWRENKKDKRNSPPTKLFPH